jgi:integrase
MSIFKRRQKGRAPSAVYSYEFWRGGRRFSGSTEETDKFKARAFERAEIAKVESQLREERETGRKPMTLDQAFTFYADEVLAFLPSKAGGERELHWLEDFIGADKPVHELTNVDVAEITNARRACMKRSGRDTQGRPLYKPIANATVNRTLEYLRAALWHARDRHEALIKPSLKIKKLVEPKARVREASAAEETDLFKFMRKDFHDVMEFALLTGIRLKGCVTLTWRDVDFEHRTIRYLKKRERGQQVQWGTLPMTSAVEAILRRQIGYDRVQVWTYVAIGKKGGKGGTLHGGTFEPGKRYPITYWNLRTRFERAKAKAGVTDFRFHDWRHTAATRILRATGNLALAQRMLDHAQVTTTRKYS